MKIVDSPGRYRKCLPLLAAILFLLMALVPGTPVLAAPVVTLSPDSGAVGTSIIITGTNFDSFKGDTIYIFFDDKEIPGSRLPVSEKGVFTTQFVIPGGSVPGRHWIRIKSAVGSTSFLAENSLFVEAPALIPDATEGPVGTNVTASGRGFYAGRTVTLYYNNLTRDKIGTVSASSDGKFSFSFVIPNSTAGIHRITATDTEGNSAETDFRVLAAVRLSLNSAGPGQLLSIRGNGFARQRFVWLTFGSIAVTSPMTNDYGSFEVEFYIPEVKAGLYIIKALDETGNQDTEKFTVTAGASLSQSGGAIGSRVTIAGSGFSPGKTVTVDFDTTRVATATADNEGGFTATFSIPRGQSGPHVITVSDGITTKQFDYAIESNAPPVPGLTLPINNSVTGAEAYLDWLDITDASLPVVYGLEIASDQNFSNPVLQKEGLANSEYTLTANESLTAGLKPSPYFWRVKAVDGAGNKSEWSEPWLFYISAPPVPALLVPQPDVVSEVPVFFKWQAVASLSPPVTYHLQVATDANFTSPLLDKTGLTAPEYLLPKKEIKLEREIKYYWRVKAVDGASNESVWTAAGSFYASAPFKFPGWVIYTLIGIGVIIVGFVAFRAGKRSAYGLPNKSP